MATLFARAAPHRQALRLARPELRCIHSMPKRPQPQFARNAFHQKRQASFIGNATALFRQYPLQMVLAFGVILGGASGILYAHYKYQEYIINSFHKYPEPVAKKLRRALYYTNQDLQPKEAVKYYKEALEVAEELRMDPFSDEILGVKIQVASLMEKLQQYWKAVEVLEMVRNDNLRWLERHGFTSDQKQNRTRILAKTIAISVKLGDLYANPAVYKRDVAEQRLVWAVETAITERQRRTNENVKDEVEGAWLSDGELGAALESLAHNYEEKSQHYLATPLFLQALNMYPNKDCHTVVLMNNLATSLAQQSPAAARAAQAYAESQSIVARPSGPAQTRETMIDNAKTWAHKALEMAAAVKPPDRNEECDVGCAVATHNLGEFAEMLNDVSEAKKRYSEAISLARAIGFQEGVDNSAARLRQLQARG